MNAVHFADETAEAEVIEANTSDVQEGGSATVEFVAESFSVYGVIYTVDFHWEVDGNTYEYSLAGGDSMSFRELAELLHIVDSDVSESSEEASEDIDEFINDIADIKFSDPELVWVQLITEEETQDGQITAGQIAKQNDLTVEYSAGTTKKQKKEMAAKSYAAGEWVLLSLKPFLSEETLTVSMKDGEVFTIKVTDVQIVKNILTADGENYVITITYSDEAEIPDRADFNVTEILPSSDDYQKYLADSAQKLNIAAGDVAYARFFDIEIVKDGKKVEPKAPVHVKIEHEQALEATLGKELNIVHFAESGTEVIENVKLGEDMKEIDYEQESFSVTGEIISNPSKGSDSDPKQYVLIVKYEGVYYSVDSDGTLTPVNSVDDPENPTTVTVGSAMVWSYDNNGTLYHHTDASDLNRGRVAADYYYKYIDISTSDDGVYEEQSYRQMTGEDVPFQKLANGDFNENGVGDNYLDHTEEHMLHTRDVDLWVSRTDHLTGQRNSWVIKEHKNAGLFKVNYDASTHKLTSENGYVLDQA